MDSSSPYCVCIVQNMYNISSQSGCCLDLERTSKSRKHPHGRLNSDMVTCCLTLGKLLNLSALTFPICGVGKAEVFIPQAIVGLNEYIEVKVVLASLELIM